MFLCFRQWETMSIEQKFVDAKEALSPCVLESQVTAGVSSKAIRERTNVIVSSTCLLRVNLSCHGKRAVGTVLITGMDGLHFTRFDAQTDEQPQVGRLSETHR